MSDCWQGDIMGIFQKVIAKKIGWKEINGLMFQKAKERIALIHFYKRLIEDARSKDLPDEIKESLTSPLELMVRSFNLYSFESKNSKK